jgi:hypothetical protein
VETGIGPICAKKYIREAEIFAPASTETLMGMIIKAEVESSVLLERLQAGDMHGVVNKLLYVASSAISYPEVVVEIARIIMACGYVRVATKLCADRMPVLTRVGDLVQIISGYHEKLPGMLRKIQGRWNAGLKLWEVPVASLESARNVLHVVYNTKYVLDGMNILERDPVEAERLLNQAAKPATPSLYRIQKVGSLVKCYTPYNPNYVASIKRQPRAQYVPADRAWLAGLTVEQATQLIQLHYGPVAIQVC